MGPKNANSGSITRVSASVPSPNRCEGPVQQCFAARQERPFELLHRDLQWGIGANAAARPSSSAEVAVEGGDSRGPSR